MKRTITALLIALTACLAASGILMGCATASAQDTSRGYEFRDISDYFADRDPEGATRIAEEQAAKAAQEQQEAAEATAAPEAEYEPAWEDYGAYGGSYASYDNGDGFVSEGVRYHEGRTETWYSSNSAYHYRTTEWTVDDEGYYRDGEGYYVVAASDYAEGDTFETSKGTAKVYDSGCDDGVTDFYVNF